MTTEELKKRKKAFAVAIIELSKLLPNNRVGWTFSDQIIRSATSVAANHRAVCRAKSDKDFVSKIETVLEEADETLFWLELIEATNSLPEESALRSLQMEANELVSIFVSGVKTVKNRLNSNQ